MPISSSPHGIGEIINEINNEYQEKYNTTEVIFNEGDTDVTVAVENETVDGFGFNAKQQTKAVVSSAEYDGLDFSDDGMKFWVANSGGSSIKEYSTDEAFDFVNPTFVNSVSVSTDIRSIQVVNDEHIYFGDHSSAYHWVMSTPGDITTATQSETSNGTPQPTTVTMSPDGSRVLFNDGSGGSSEEWATFDVGTAFDISTLTKDESASNSNYYDFDWGRGGEVLYGFTRGAIRRWDLASPYSITDRTVRRTISFDTEHTAYGFDMLPQFNGFLLVDVELGPGDDTTGQRWELVPEI